MSLQFLHNTISQEMATVDQVIRQALHSEVALINQVSHYIINSGGKRLRPALVLLTAGALGEVGATHHTLAAVVEFIHTATLLHDDVVDESALRRGRATANHLFGNAASVLVGDFVYTRAFQMMVSLKNMRVMEILAEATNIIAEGEVLQLLNIHNADISDEAYIKVIHYKTAKLFEAATRLGAVTAGASTSQEQALANYGMHLGTAFQLIDDVLDLDGNQDEIGKNLGDDIAEGKPTLPLLYAMRKGSVSQTELIKRSILQGGLDGLDDILQAVRDTDALTYVRQLAEQEADAACACLADLPESNYKTTLLTLAQFSVSRTY